MPTATKTFIEWETGEETGAEHAKLYNVVLLDDDEHTYDYVIEMLMRLFSLSEARALRHTVEVDTLGRTIVLTGEIEEATVAREMIHGYGADPRMANSKGSMTAVVEPATNGAG
ncbi:MAG: ATP-dependent Clp protease adaptor ClpS [Acidobacteriaceae bacterium]|jgi:ATP-dependent Clp protease adaptor protein ClpS|nr:ATP-dependent Clp protease adaptor ClpS [Acidobacteriaceae bacterium]